ncbi:fused MFS/spermidine synthase [Variovorax guangxiensis]|uniref:spermidine synthase n=1 Tax=Variovorax guangxiensis TaxID=1775474 RepID=UPI00285D0B6D|nr:fused MFS/spermidine synthase [Variovorax guangxiensis]MDR6853786.1 SAM-dependent methyltransferase [Variovorax guangxiensis]
MQPASIKALFAGTIFLSAFLLFLVQPLVAKQILPWFGGSAAVWSVCMVFFQVALLAGYAYADWISRRLQPRTQAKLHGALLLASLAFMPVLADASWKPGGGEEPTLRILGLLVATIGLPYFLLSTTGPLVQAWITRTPWGAQVYRYFSLSNLASLAALLCYPVLIEPRSTVQQQAWAWSAGYGAFVLLCSATAFYVAARWPAAIEVVAPSGDAPAPAVSPETKPRLIDQLLWLLLPALGSWLLLAVTNHVTQNVAPVPFLWVLPLSVYLLTFILSFESDRWYRRAVVLPLTAAMLALCAYGLQDSIGSHLRTGLPIYLVGLFLLCLCLHGETARLRPGPSYLTRFYLMLSLGGAAGGALVGLVAPHVLPTFYELGIGLVLCALAAALVWRHRRMGVLASLAMAACCGWFLAEELRDDARARRMDRNFYGAMMVVDSGILPDDRVRRLYHGATLHGEQYLSPANRRWPGSYYSSSSGVGRAIEAAPAGPRRVGLIGLGAGTLAAYGRPGDVYRVYEINPRVFELADTEFSYLRDSDARIERVLADARLALEREAPQGFDVLAVDAFSADSVPAHLLTVQAMDIYLRHMKPGGVIAFHVSNRYLHLDTVVAKLAQVRGLHTALIDDTPDEIDVERSIWMLVARDPQALEREPVRSAATQHEAAADLAPWTDDFNNLFSVLR